MTHNLVVRLDPMPHDSCPSIVDASCPDARGWPLTASPLDDPFCVALVLKPTVHARPPGTLSDADNAFAAQPLGGPLHGGAVEHSALRAAKRLACQLPELVHPEAELAKIFVADACQDMIASQPHRSGAALRLARRLRERRALALTEQTACAAVNDNDDPMRGNVQANQSLRRGLAISFIHEIGDEPAVRETVCANPRATAAAQKAGLAAGIPWARLPRFAQSTTNRQRQLSPGPQPNMQRRRAMHYNLASQPSFRRVRRIDRQ
jgi:hypothetical protein